MSNASSTTVSPVDFTRAVTVPAQRTATEDATPAGRVEVCRCGHGADSHQHFRAGSDCSTCLCGRYRTTTGFAATLGTLLRRTVR